ncbi:MAG: dienelactone hydrolase family protein [Myxococcales bacterium]|nr:dienelactone hydrolase family protein [Myxococcales bacterium]
MASIVLFHSALGLTAGVKELAAELARDGHEVQTPDLFDGETFLTVEDGVKKRDALGIPELMRRSAEAAEKSPASSIYIGLSMGAAAAQFLAGTRPGARGAVLLHAALPLAAMGLERWPDVPVEIHASEADPWVDDAALDAFAHASGAQVFRYPGAAHLFSDTSSPDHDASQRAELVARVRAFARR